MRPAPCPTAETKVFWHNCSNELLTYQHCLRCGNNQFYPRILCAKCKCLQLEWRPSAGFGRIYSFTIVHRAPVPAFRADAPYVVALIDFDEGFRMMLNIVECNPNSISIGMPVETIFEHRGPLGLRIPQARPLNV